MTKTTQFFGYSAVLMIAAVAFASLANAQTYYYVATDGSLAAEEASTADEALATAANIMPNSGVITESDYERLNGSTNVTVTEETETEYEVTNNTMTTSASYDADSETYLYVTAMDELSSIMASNPDEAIATAPNIKYNSGVMVATE